jgi:type I restriction enzyme S subunit
VIPDDKMLKSNDIFICMSNGSTQHLGKVAFVKDDLDYAFGGFMGAIHPHLSQVFPKYVFYACLSEEYRRFLASIFNGININNLKWSDLSGFTIPTPSLSEQERIVAELDLLQGIIDKQKAQLKELELLAFAFFHQTFGNLVENDKQWNISALDSLCEVTSSKRVYQSELSETGIPFYRISDFSRLLNNDYLDPDLHLSETKYNELKANGHVPQEGDVLITSRGTLGNCYIVQGTDTFYFQDGMISWLKNINPKVHPLFISFLFKDELIKRQVSSLQSGSTVAYLSIGMLKKLRIPTPPVLLQQAFATKIEAIERQKASINASIAETQKLFDYTMDKYFG